jgi:hypothetical protein
LIVSLRSVQQPPAIQFGAKLAVEWAPGLARAVALLQEHYIRMPHASRNSAELRIEVNPSYRLPSLST